MIITGTLYISTTNFFNFSSKKQLKHIIDDFEIVGIVDFVKLEYQVNNNIKCLKLSNIKKSDIISNILKLIENERLNVKKQQIKDCNIRWRAKNKDKTNIYTYRYLKKKKYIYQNNYYKRNKKIILKKLKNIRENKQKTEEN